MLYLDHAATSYPTFFHPSFEHGNPSASHMLGRKARNESTKFFKQRKKFYNFSEPCD